MTTKLQQTVLSLVQSSPKSGVRIRSIADQLHKSPGGIARVVGALYDLDLVDVSAGGYYVGAAMYAAKVHADDFVSPKKGRGGK